MVIRSTAGNRQCLPLCGALLSSTLLALRYADAESCPHPVLSTPVEEKTPAPDEEQEHLAPVETAKDQV